MSTPEQVVAAFTAGLDLADLPEAVVAESKTLTADTLAAMLNGSRLDAVQRLAADGATAEPGETTVVGTGLTTSRSQAALINGTGGSMLELNAGHKYAAGHPIIHVFPAVLAEAETRACSGATFLSAVVAGYEVCTRTAIASNPLADKYLPHGVWGAVGAAAGVARCRGLDAETTLTAMQVAASFAQHTRFEATNEGATGVRNGTVGMANVGGIVAVDLAEAGFTGLDDGVAKQLERTTAGGFETAALADGLGDRWEILRGYYKRHAAGRLTHPAIDAAADIQREHDVDPAAIESIAVETYEKAAKWVGGTEPKNRLQAKSSLPFGVVTRLVHGESGLQAFEPEAFTDDVYDLLARVSVRTDPVLNARVPDARSARVTIRTSDGQEYSKEVEHARGGAERPYSQAELREKFDDLVGAVLGADATVDLWSAVQNLPTTEPRTLCVRAAGGAARPD